MALRKINIFILCYLIFPTSLLIAQDQKIADSLSRIYDLKSISDSSKLKLLQGLSFHEVKDLRSGLAYAEELVKLAEKTDNYKYQRIGYFLQGTKYRMLNELDKALEAYIKSAEIAEKLGFKQGVQESYGAMGDTYAIAKNYVNAHLYYDKAIAIVRSLSSYTLNDSANLATFLLNKGDAFLNAKQFDSALTYSLEANALFDKLNNKTGIGYSSGNMGMAYANLDENEIAEQNLLIAIPIVEAAQDYYPVSVYLLTMADIFLKKGDAKAALANALRSFQLANDHGLKEQIASASLKLSELYEKSGDTKEALKFFKKHIAYRDSVINLPIIQNMANQLTHYEVSKKEVELDLAIQQKQNERNRTISLAIILALSVIILAISIRNNQHKQKAYKRLNIQKQKTDEQKARAEDALTELQETQKQLIQAAKMASLGELTAGIAHEIQNPLNFVNNFSEVSVELLGELKEGSLSKLAAADRAEADKLLNDLSDNLRRVSDHGKRADAIVKGMLQHTRLNTGKHEPTDLNALADEYLRLSYHGISAQGKEFNPKFMSDFDVSIDKIDIVPQDIGRVLLNLYNNAFYAVIRKKQQEDGVFDPLVLVNTKRVGNKVAISVKDNGTGIPQNMLDKIFQPFFTTKPTGQGTGLGLWFAYDIVHAHGGEIKVETKEGAFSEFIIHLPIGRQNTT